MKAHTIILQNFQNAVGQLMLFIMGMNSYCQISHSTKVLRLFLSKLLYQSRCCGHLYVFHWVKGEGARIVRRYIEQQKTMESIYNTFSLVLF